MKITKLMWCAFCAVVLVAFSLVGCEELDTYSIKAPIDLQARIDSIAAAKAGMDTGDTTYLDIATAIVGAEDNSTGWNGAHSDYFTIPTNKLLHLEFINHGTGGSNWNNWNLGVDIVKTNSEDYDPNNGAVAYFTLRSDAFGWGNADFDPGLISITETGGDGDVWNDFLATMQGAYVTLEVDHSVTGNVYVTATAVGTNGVTLIETYEQPVSATEDIVAYLVTDGSHFQMKKAYLLPSKVTAVEDVNPVSIEITGAPESVEIGNENFWGAAVATVTFADGSSAEIDSTDLSFTVIPVMTTLGEKTVIVAYSKTKQGAFTKAVSTFYTLEVTNPIVSIEASNINYYYYSSDDITFKPAGIVVTATYSDNSTDVLENSALDFDYPGTISPTVGSQMVDITYVGPTSTFTTTSTVTLIQGTAQVGANDFSTGFWGAHSADFTVAPGASKTFKLYVYSTNVNNFNSPVTILRKADLSLGGAGEYAVVRMDNFGWGQGYDNNPNRINTFDWNWDTFAANISGSYIEITVTNHGDNTADIRYDVTYATGETHFQEYTGITVDSADLTTALTVDGCYLVLIN